jgi:soluble lytic murein transglycosylase
MTIGVLLMVAALGGGGPGHAVAELGRGFRAYRAGEYEKAAHILGGVAGKDLRNDDWALFLLAESEFYAGDYKAARGHFERLARAKHAVAGRPSEMAPARLADCLWQLGEREQAAAAYAKLAKRPQPWGDVALARFRVAEAASARDPEGARKQFLMVARDFPAHPLGDEALRRAGTGTSTGTSTGTGTGVVLSPVDRLRRAEALSRDRHWDEALAELDKLPADLATSAPELAVRRDYQIGMTKFHMRRDYTRAAELLLGAAPHLTGDDAASAAFHGARALSRVDRDDEAIVGYRKVVAEFPRSRYAAEAQYLSGWLDYNRGRFRESLPGLEATLQRFGKSAFADDAAWCLAFAHYQLGDADAAFTGFDRYARMPATGMTADERAAQVAYWRARLHEKLGHKDEAAGRYRELVHRAPLSFYGLLAAARLRAAGGAAADVQLASLSTPSEPAPLPPPHQAERDPAVARALELLEAGMNMEAGWELERSEKEIVKRAGGADQTLPWLLDLYRRAGDFHRAYQLADVRATATLAAPAGAPAGAARALWEAAYPRAFSELIDRYGPPAGNPDVFLYAIMRKESGYNPHDVSYADARGLLQMIPPTSAHVAATAGLSFFPDELYDPEVNVRLGAAYIGSLFKKFGGQVPLAAGAYNAGPRAMARWCDQHGGHPTDEFVELIAFAQTREYAKRVTSLYARYRYLYGPTPYEIPLTLELKYRADGPDY